MRRSGLRFLAISSAVALLISAYGRAESRPRYGGSMRVELVQTPSLVPGAPDANDAISRLIYDSLVRLDDQARPQPALATTWEAQSGARRWQFWLRSGVKFHDGTLMKAADVAESLTAANPAWHVRAVGASVVLEFDDPMPQLAAELALSRNAIYHGSAGTGAFRLVSANNGRFVLQANDDYWDGRPFLDTVEILTELSLRDIAVDFAAGRADLADVDPAARTREIATSQPIELLALGINAPQAPLSDPRLREALSLAIDRTAIHRVLLQRRGDITGGLLPNWISGYDFLFPTAQDTNRAHELVRQVANVRPLSLTYDRRDALARSVAERIAVDARQAGIILRPTAADDPRSGDIAVRRVPVPSADAQVALFQVLQELGASPEPAASLQAVYEMESEFLRRRTVVPIAHLPLELRVSPRVRNWTMAADGDWGLEQVCVTNVKPEDTGGPR